MARLIAINAAELQAEDDARLEALGTRGATIALLGALGRLAKQEARRIGAPSIDFTYHGCDPAWRAALKAASDLAAVELGARSWGVWGIHTLTLAEGEQTPVSTHPEGD